MGQEEKSMWELGSTQVDLAHPGWLPALNSLVDTILAKRELRKPGDNSPKVQADTIFHRLVLLKKGGALRY